MFRAVKHVVRRWIHETAESISLFRKLCKLVGNIGEWLLLLNPIFVFDIQMLDGYLPHNLAG